MRRIVLVEEGEVEFSMALRVRGEEVEVLI